MTFTAWLLGFDATPSPVPGFTGDPNDVTPGVIGFAAIFLIAAATVLLVLDMTRRVRLVRYRGEIRERLEAEAEADSSAVNPPKPRKAPGDSSPQ